MRTATVKVSAPIHKIIAPKILLLSRRSLKGWAVLTLETPSKTAIILPEPV
jgi:hypothetical protein